MGISTGMLLWLEGKVSSGSSWPAGQAAHRSLKASTGQVMLSPVAGMGTNVTLDPVWLVLVHFKMSTNPGGCLSKSPLQVCLVGSNFK